MNQQHDALMPLIRNSERRVSFVLLQPSTTSTDDTFSPVKSRKQSIDGTSTFWAQALITGNITPNEDIFINHME